MVLCHRALFCSVLFFLVFKSLISLASSEASAVEMRWRFPALVAE